jgi:hypothetical protein
VHENVANQGLNTRPTILKLFFVHFYHFRWVCQKLDLKHLLSKYQVMNEMQSFKEERNFITNAKEKLKKCL